MTAAATALRPTAATPPAPAQLALDGLPPPEPGLRLAIVGHLQRRGELRISTDGRAHLVVQVLQPRDGLAFVAVWHQPAGDEFTRADLEHLAKEMLPGAVVVLTGHGLVLDLHEGHQVLRLVRCTAVSRVSDPARYFLTAPAAAGHPVAPQPHLEN